MRSRKGASSHTTLVSPSTNTDLSAEQSAVRILDAEANRRFGNEGAPSGDPEFRWPGVNQTVLWTFGSGIPPDMDLPGKTDRGLKAFIAPYAGQALTGG